MKLIAARKVTVRSQDGTYVKYRPGQPIPDGDKIPGVDAWMKSGHIMKEGDPGAPKVGEKFGEGRRLKKTKNKPPETMDQAARAKMREEVKAELKAEMEAVAKAPAKSSEKPAAKPGKGK